MAAKNPEFLLRNRFNVFCLKVEVILNKRTFKYKL
jgi:hypothetical protein